MAPQVHHKRYAEAMMTCGNGYGFFHPPSDVRDNAKPGVCGYIDDNGIWRAIVDLNDSAALETANLSPPELIPNQTISHLYYWGPKCSNTVRETTVGLEAGLAAGIPAEFSSRCKYSTQFDFAALLLCGDEVFHTSYPHCHPFRKWGKANAKHVLEMCRDVATHGFFIITSTWSAQDVYLKVLTNNNDDVTIGIKGDIPQAGGVGASVEYHRGGASGGWEHPIVDGNERRVVFFGGVYFKYRSLMNRFSYVPQSKWPGYLGDDDDDVRGKFLVETESQGSFEAESFIVPSSQFVVPGS